MFHPGPKMKMKAKDEFSAQITNHIFFPHVRRKLKAMLTLDNKSFKAYFMLSDCLII